MGRTLTEAGEIYEQLWRKTGPLLKSGKLRIDPFLRNKTADNRRGVTLVARPNIVVQQKVESLLSEAAGICPGQHFYKPAELHVTVMAIIPGSESWKEEIERLRACRAALDDVLKNAQTFRVNFRGVTVSPDAVMIQGFPEDDSILELRNRLRDTFQRSGLGGNLDRRYKTTTAHLTVMRFSEPGSDWKQLFDFLQAHRETGFGQTQFQSLQLIFSNWYASADIVQVLQDYPLKG